jgi:hypothetical protein
MAGGPAWYLATRAADKSDTETSSAGTHQGSGKGDGSGQGSSGSDDVATGAGTDTAVTDESAEEPLPSFVRYAYVRAVTGSAGAWEASLDLFDIFTGAEAESYAASHGMTVPDNGILYANDDETPESFPLSDAAVITYTTGGVEALETHTATIQQLRDYAAGSTTAMPDAYRDQWRVTVENGVVTKVEMIAVAD